MNDKFITYFIITILFSTKILASQSGRASLPPATCDAIGTFCTDDCETIFSCTEMSKPPIAQLLCADVTGEKNYCKETGNNTATCSSDTVECKGKASVKILCGQFGEFPNPFDCKKSIKCKGSGEEPFATCTCKGEDVIDITAAGLPCISPGGTPPDWCGTFTEKCASGPGTEVRIGTSNYYFTCLDDGAMVFLNPPTLLYPKINLKEHEKDCVESQPTQPTTSSTDDPATPPVSQSSTDTSEPTTDTSDLPTDPTSLPGDCTKVDEKFPDPKCCHCYYRCNKNLQLEHRVCPKTPEISHFDQKMRSCKKGDCKDAINLKK